MTTVTEAPGPTPKGMVWIPGGEFAMGSDIEGFPEEWPIHQVTVDGFWIDETPATVAQFRRFVNATGYVTVAERQWDLSLYPELPTPPPAPGSLVFVPTRGRVDLTKPVNWWHYIPGASWMHPEGPESSVGGREYHPVVHVAWEDVVAYAEWAGKALPTEAEWERAARGGLDGARYTWGDKAMANGRMLANVWEGEFPWENTKPLARRRTTKVRSYAPNGYGLYDMAGNVWEWTEDFFRSSHENPDVHPCCTVDNPRVPMEMADSDELGVPRRVLKGGSHLCSVNYCQRYRPAARQPQMVDSSMSHVGFRCIVRP
jgi:formylglycine-generating enzyme